MGKWARNSFFKNLLENLVIKFFWIWSITKVYIICDILAQIPYLGKIWSGKNLVSDIWVKMLLANQIAEFLNQQYL